MRVKVREVLCTLCLGVLGSTAFCTSPIGAQVEVARLGTLGETAEWTAQDSGRGRTEVRQSERGLSLRLRDVTLKEALRIIAKQTDVILYYNDGDLPRKRIDSVDVVDETPEQAVLLVLQHTHLTVRTIADTLVIERLPRTIEHETSADSVGSISGTVVDSTSLEPVAGSRIVLDPGGRAALSGEDGRFRITSVPPGAYTIAVRRLGYSPQSRPVVVKPDIETEIHFRLAAAARLLDQMVTTATGDQARKEVGNVIARIEVDSVVHTAPVVTMNQLLAGRVAGLQVLFTGGMTGVSAPINIRGQNSYSLSNQPLLVVDGVRVENGTASASTGPTYAGLSSGRFNDLDPSEIQSIEIVKGPSAATLYGTDAANGVIVVTTKRGREGRARWRLFADGGLLTYDRSRFPTSYFPWGHSTSGEAGAIRCTLPNIATGTCVQDSVTNFSPLRDPETTPIGRGSRHSIGVQVSGGSTVRYFLSGVAESETGYLKMPAADETLLEAQAGRELTREELHPNGVTRYAARSNLTVPLADRFEVSISTSLSRSNIRIPEPTSLLFGGASTGVRDMNDGWTFGSRAGNSLIKRNHEQVTHMTSSATGNWRPTDWLTGHLTLGIDYSTDYVDRLAPYGLGVTASPPPGSRENTKLAISLQTFDAGLTLRWPLASSLSSRTSIGAQYNRRTLLSNTAAAQFLTPGAETVAGGATPIVSESTLETVVAGTYVEEQIGWRDRVYVTGAARVDGASSFGSGFDAAVYPKASVSWLLSDESFWPAIPGVNSFRVRAAYGQSGVQPGPVAALTSESLFSASVKGIAATGSHLGAIGNRDLKPERQRELEVGLDLQLFRDRLTLEGTYYDKRSSDALVNVPLPASFGGGTRWANFGAVLNRGYEAALRARIISMPSLDWNVALNGSVNHNEVLAISPSADAIYNNGTSSPGLVRGYPMYSYFDYPIERVSDANGNGIIEPTEIEVGDAPAFGGAGFPRTQISGTSSLGLLGGRLRLEATVERRSGYVILNAGESLRCLFGSCVGVAIPGASPESQAANVARATPALHNTYWGFYEDGAFTRLREVSATYSLPRSIAARLRARSASLTLSGRNLALWSAYGGADPEVYGFPGGASGTAATYDRTGVPAAAYWLFRLNLEF